MPGSSDVSRPFGEAEITHSIYDQCALRWWVQEMGIPMKLRIVAREWLYFLGSVCFGLILAPAVALLLLRPGAEFSGRYSQFWSALLRGQFEPWLFALAPYIGLQIVRSVIWSVMQLRRPS